MPSKPTTAARGPEGCVVRRAKNGKTKIVKTGGWRWSLQAEKVFLEHLAATANVRAASAEAGFSQVTAYKQRMQNPGFAARWQQALETGVARLEMLLIHSAGATLEGLPLDGDHASRGKSARAEPVAALFESGRAVFAGNFPALEAELSGLQTGGGYAPGYWSGPGGPGQGPGASPDRADAMVWALTALMLETPPPEPRIRVL